MRDSQPAMEPPDDRHHLVTVPDLRKSPPLNSLSNSLANRSSKTVDFRSLVRGDTSYTLARPPTEAGPCLDRPLTADLRPQNRLRPKGYRDMPRQFRHWLEHPDSNVPLRVNPTV